MSNYELNIISHHPEFANKALKKFHVDGIDTVGAYGNETFSVVFKNNTWSKVQVKLSIDGIDIATGEKATTDVAGEMWVVNPYSSLTLKAWKETNDGGASFVFTNASNGVATHVNGDLSHRGIIAAAVFVEGHVEPVKAHYCQCLGYCNCMWKNYSISGGIGNVIRGYKTTSKTKQSFTANDFSGTGTLSFDDHTIMNSTISNESIKCSTDVSDKSYAESDLVAVGAGSYTEQKVTYVQGLVKPMFTETVRVKYLWWDDLKDKLKKNNYITSSHPSGFPGDTNKGIDLKNTPRLNTETSVKRIEQSFSRV